MLVISWLVLVVDGSETIECTSNLEHCFHLIFKELFSTAVVIEAKVREIIKVFIDLATMIKHEVQVKEETLELDKINTFEILKHFTNVVHLVN